MELKHVCAMHGAVQKLKGYSTDDLLLRTKAAGLDYAADWMSTGLPGKKLQVQTFVRPTLRVYYIHTYIHTYPLFKHDKV